MPPKPKPKRRIVGYDRFGEPIFYHTPSAADEVASGVGEGLWNTAKGLVMFPIDVLRGLSAYTPEELRRDDTREYLHSQGIDPDVLLHEALKARGRGEPLGASETAKAVIGGMATLGYNAQRNMQGGGLWEWNNGHPRLVQDNPDVSPRDFARNATEQVANAMLLRAGRKAELRSAVRARVMRNLDAMRAPEPNLPKEGMDRPTYQRRAAAAAEREAARPRIEPSAGARANDATQPFESLQLPKPLAEHSIEELGNLEQKIRANRFAAESRLRQGAIGSTQPFDYDLQRLADERAARAQPPRARPDVPGMLANLSRLRAEEVAASAPKIRTPFLPEGAPEILGSPNRAIFRVETPRGAGPYQSERLAAENFSPIQYARAMTEPGVPKRDWLRGMAGDQPTLDFDQTRAMRGTDIFGFPSRAAYEEWFTPHERALMQREGYNLNRYDVPPEAISVETPEQLTFDPDAATLLQSEPPGLLHLFDPRKGVPNIAPLEKIHGRPESGYALNPAEPGSILRVPQSPVLGGTEGLPSPAKPRVWRERLDIARRTLESPLFEEDVRRGAGQGFDYWYNTDPVFKEFVDRLGPEQGKAHFDELMQFMGPTSLQTPPVANLRNAAYQFYRTANPQTPLFAEGFKPLYRTQVGNAISQLLEHGGEQPIANSPKTTPYTHALRGDWARHVLDVHGRRAAMDYGLPIGGSYKSPGITTWWDPYSQAFAERAQEFADRGLVRVPAGRDPTAAVQAAQWGGAGPRTGVFGLERARPEFWQIFEDAVGRTAQHTGMDPGEVLDMFVRKKLPLF